MRISDWSSDVCSSDLVGVAVTEHDRRLDLVDEADRRAAPQHVVDAVLVRLAEIFLLQIIVIDRHVIVADEVGDARPGDRRLEPCRLGDEPVGVLAPVTRAFDAEPVGIDPRSEEHTSELQSLMRISYAVFCSKKKLKTQT